MTGANRSSAVMQQRRADGAERRSGRDVAPKELEYFPTPPWATRALCEFLSGQLGDLTALTCWEPACGEGHMVKPLREYFGTVKASDVHPYGDLNDDCFDFTQAHMLPDLADSEDFVVFNPPFRLAVPFIEAAAAVARVGFAMLVRGAFLEGEERHAQLFDRCPPDFVLQFSERVVMLEGRLIEAGKVDPFAERPGTKASTATAYAWLVWLRGRGGDTRLRWIGKCRRKLELPGDYPDYLASLPDAPPEGLFKSLDAGPATPTGAGQ